MTLLPLSQWPRVGAASNSSGGTKCSFLGLLSPGVYSALPEKSTQVLRITLRPCFVDHTASGDPESNPH